jgi:hypothetical protein
LPGSTPTRGARSAPSTSSASSANRCDGPSRLIQLTANYSVAGSDCLRRKPVPLLVPLIAIWSGAPVWKHDDAHETITFGDINFDLRIISADLRSSTLVVHSKEKHATRSVAEAVAASVCIPLVFKPKSFADAERAETHVDGGMLSNFPAWVFADLTRPSQEPLPVLGFELD